MTRTHQHIKKPPVVVADFTALDAEWAAYIRQGALADGGAAYAKRWEVWVAHCAEEGLDPWDAPASAFESLWLLRRESDGALVSPDYVEGISVAVSHFYGQKGLTAANKRPENRGRWLDLRKSRRKTAAQNRDPEASVVPMMRTDALTLLAAPPPALRPVRRAALLLLLEGFAPSVIDALSTGDITAADRVDAGVVVHDQHLACDHEERVRGVPWDCLACAVREARDHLGPGEAFHTGLINKTGELRTRFRHFARKGEPWGPRRGLTEWEAAGLRRAVVLSTSEAKGEGYRWARARAWTGAAWSCGLRMGSDTDRLDRGALTSDMAGRGWSLRLAATKDDPAGTKEVVRPFGWDDGDGTVSAALAEYACVRDALVGEQGRLLVGLGGKTHGKPLGASDAVARSDLDLLARRAGADPVFSSYSTRKGFAAQALADGWSEDQIQEGLRHLHLSTTITRYLPKTGAKKVARKFADRVAAEASGR
ncbi:hypothetical protein GCM10009844_00650 [Nocardioides koreensis]|uniref:Tyr recombinase domain-containing protein n=1 Tax=Nocardioides koreensis TaxID=433651 RepID=A0ABN2Z1S7_9ACTN